eukprot:4359187-Amphidinium_carterae.1
MANCTCGASFTLFWATFRESGKTLATLSQCPLAQPKGLDPRVPPQVATHEATPLGGAPQVGPAAAGGVS